MTMGATSLSEKCVAVYQTTQHDILEDTNLKSETSRFAGKLCLMVLLGNYSATSIISAN
jgi:hypothetical protein